MIAPVIIQILFWLGAAAAVILGFISIGEGIRSDNGSEDILVGLVSIFAGPITWRILCEVLILFFRMNETLTEIKNSLESEA